MPVHEIRHPLIRHKLGIMRRADLSTKSFRELSQEVGALLTYEASMICRWRPPPSKAGVARSRSRRSPARKSPWCPSCAPASACWMAC